MDTEELYDKLISDGTIGGRTLVLNPVYLAGLSTSAGGLLVAAVTSKVCRYFPSGAIEVTDLEPVARPSNGGFIEWKGNGVTAPFEGMRLEMKLWTQLQAGASELHLIISAHGAAPNSGWTLQQGFPFYKDSLLGALRFKAIDDPQYALLTLSSHERPAEKLPSGLYCAGMLNVNSVLDTAPKLFLGEDAKDKYILSFGVIAVSPPPSDEAAFGTVRPSICLFGNLPHAIPKRKLGDLFPIGSIRYAWTAAPVYNTATRKWEASCSVVWVANLELPGISASEPVSIPIGVEIKRRGKVTGDNDGPIRFFSDLTDGLSLAWESLAGCIPNIPLRIPDCGFRLQDHVKLTQFEVLARTQSRELLLDAVKLRVETTEDKNRWVLIDRLLTLDAIDFLIAVRDPLGTSKVHFSISGLVGIGPTGTLQLTADFAGDESAFTFRGHLVKDAPLNIREVLTHFLGNSNYPAVPALAVEEFSFAVQPQLKLYEGEIALSGDWQLLPNFALRNVSFSMSHDDSEGDSAFQAVGVIYLAGAELYVAADYISNGQGWTFSGGTYDNDEIPIGDWVTGALGLLGWNADIALPAPIRDLTLLSLGVRINTVTQEYSFQGTAKFPIDGVRANDNGSAELTVQMDLDQQRATFRGYLTLFEREFAVSFATDGANAGQLVATYDGTKADPINLKQLLSQISDRIGSRVNPAISIDLRRAQLAFDKNGNASKFLFGIELGAGIQLSNLPAVGCLFSRDQTLSVVLHLLAASAKFEESEIKSINRLTGPETTKIPERAIGGVEPEFKLQAAVNFGGFTKQLELPLATDVGKIDSAPAPKPSVKSAGGSGLVSWVAIEKTLGPFHFYRIGIGSDGETIAFLIDASLRTAGLTIALNGLAARCTFAQLSNGAFEPVFELSGLGVSFKKGDLEIGGALIKRPAGGGYDGAAIIHYKRLGIEAMGSYQTIDGQPSLFIYALIDYPLGGPSFFFVEGGAVGFGYNHSLTIPAIDAVSDFPLVKQAMSPPRSRLGPLEVARELSTHIQPAAGQYFLAAGIRFSSFKTIEGFVLLTVLFGDHFEIDVLGKATLTSPPRQLTTGNPSLLSASLVLLGRYLPEDGLLMVRAQLAPDARLFAPDCHLAGGFALYCWFDKTNKGDFVLTLGGYHKSFQVPAHYPKVPRLALNWQVNPNLSIKADAYFALTPSTLMAGAHLEANWQSGNLQAWFRAELDFLIGWQPAHYEGHVFVSLGARYRFEFFGKREISAELTAELDVWGPPFSGRAHVQWHIISFDIDFGEERRAPKPLTWAEFKNSFLPVGEDRMFSVSTEGGKLAQRGSQAAPSASPNKIGDLGVINPRDLCIALRSPLPVKRPEGSLLMLAVDSSPVASEPDLGIAPMDKDKTKWYSTLEVKIVQKAQGKPDADRSDQFRATRLRTSIPASLWDEHMDPRTRLNKRPIENAICGYEIQPLIPVRMTGSVKLPTKASSPVLKSVGWPRSPQGEPVITRTTQSIISANRLSELPAMVKELLPALDIDWSSVTVESWRHPPKIVKVTTQAIIGGME
jgi:hypothetical protein